MINCNIRKCVILLSLMLLHPTHTSACLFYERHIHVVSNLPQNSPHVLKLRCASRDKELGVHYLQPNQEFQFGFCVNPFATLYFCHLWWGQKEKAFNVYSVDTKKWCNGLLKLHCTWLVWKDGIYFLRKVPNPLQVLASPW